MAENLRIQHAVNVRALTFAYHDRTVVRLDNLELEPGESLAVLGPSGCGKTTLMHLLAGLLTPQAGTVEILGQPLTQMTGTELDRFRGQSVGMVFQKLFLIPSLTARENIALARKLARKPQDDVRVDSLLEQLGISPFANHKPNMLSHGQAQRVAIARALVHYPALVLADEPTSALDDDHAASALDLLKEATEEAGAALIVVTHDQRVRGQLDRELEMGATP